MKAGTTISAIAHAIILGWGLVSFSAKPLEAPPVDAVVADVISETEFSQITNGVRTAKQTPAPAPVVDKVGEVKEPPKDPTLKVANKQEVVTDSAPPPAPPQPDPKPDPKPVEAKPPDPKPAPTPPAAAEEPPQPDPAAEAAKRAEEAKRKEEQKKIEEAKKREEAKKAQEARKREEAKNREAANKDLDRIQALLDKRAQQRQAVTGTMINPTPSLGTTTGTASQLSQSELARLLAMLRQQLSACWNPPMGVREAKTLVVTVSFSLNPDGSLASRPHAENDSRDPLFQTAKDTAIRAVESCQPIRLPAAKYEVWRNVEVNFDPTQM
jgi:colicin import membrane protein